MPAVTEKEKKEGRKKEEKTSRNKGKESLFKCTHPLIFKKTD